MGFNDFNVIGVINYFPGFGNYSGNVTSINIYSFSL